MKFCKSCGNALQPDARFCGACGTATTVATTDQPPSPLPASAKAPDPGRKPRFLTKRNGLAIVGAAVLATVAIVVLSIRSPSDSLENARAAYAERDAETFHRYVDVESVIADWTDQAVDSLVVRNNSSALEIVGWRAAAEYFKQNHLSQVAQWVEGWLVSGQLADNPQAAGSNSAIDYILGFVSDAFRTMVDPQLKYQGVVSQAEVGSDVVLNVAVGSTISSDPVTVKVKMRRDGLRWRIVAIQDIQGLMQQLHLSPN